MFLKNLRIIAVILTVTGVFVASNIYTFIPIYNHVATSIHISENEAVIAGSLFTVFYGWGLLFYGATSDKLGIKKILVVGMLLSALSTSLIALSESLYFLYVARSLQGFFLASFAPMAFAYSFELFKDNARTLLLVFINTGYLVAGIFGQVISSAIANEFGWRYVFYFFAISYFIFFIISFFLLPTSIAKHTKESSLSTLASLIRTKGLVKCYIITFSLLFSSVAFYDTLERTYENAQILRMIGLIGAFLSIFTGKFMERWKISGTLYLGICINLLSIILMLFFNERLIVLVTILFISSIAVLIPTVVTRIGMISGENRVKALAVYSFILLMGASFAPVLVVQLSYFQVLFVLLGFYSVNLFLVKQKD
jgi:predicted MFS family arabinose efflux permease